MRVGAQEPLSQLAPRIQRRLGVADEEFAKWRFCLVKGIAASAAEWLQDEDVVAERLSRHGGLLGGTEQPYLGLNHAVTHPKRAQPRSTSLYERAIKIYS